MYVSPNIVYVLAWSIALFGTAGVGKLMLSESDWAWLLIAEAIFLLGIIERWTRDKIEPKASDHRKRR